MTAASFSDRSGLVVYESMFGCTAQVARAIGEGLADYVRVHVHDVQQGPPGAEAMPDLLVVGGPTHAFSMSRPTTRRDAIAQGGRLEFEDRGIREWIAQLPAADPAGRTLVATFDTRMRKARHLPGSAARAATKRLRSRGYRMATDPETFTVEDVQGPVSDGELARARDWGQRLGMVFVSDALGQR